MKAVVINEFGGREKLTLDEVPTPEPAEGEVLVRIKAAGVNPVDWKIREGWLKDLLPYEFPMFKKPMQRWKPGTPGEKSF